jgi:hypothetical protein
MITQSMNIFLHTRCTQSLHLQLLWDIFSKKFVIQCIVIPIDMGFILVAYKYKPLQNLRCQMTCYFILLTCHTRCQILKYAHESMCISCAYFCVCQMPNTCKNFVKNTHCLGVLLLGTMIGQR